MKEPCPLLYFCPLLNLATSSTFKLAECGSRSAALRSQRSCSAQIAAHLKRPPRLEAPAVWSAELKGERTVRLFLRFHCGWRVFGPSWRYCGFEPSLSDRNTLKDSEHYFMRLTEPHFLTDFKGFYLGFLQIMTLGSTGFPYFNISLFIIYVELLRFTGTVLILQYLFIFLSFYLFKHKSKKKKC